MNLLPHLTMSVETVAFMAPPSDFRFWTVSRVSVFTLVFGGQLELSKMRCGDGLQLVDVQRWTTLYYNPKLFCKMRYGDGLQLVDVRRWTTLGYNLQLFWQRRISTQCMKITLSMYRLS